MTDASKRTVGRRTVVRGAVATAWAVPLVQAVAAAPALAAASGPPNLSTTTGKVSRSNTDLTVTAHVTNSGGSATSTLTATVYWAPTDRSKIVSTSGPSGWSAGPGTPAVSWTTTTLLDPAKPLSVTIKVTTDTKKPAGTLTVAFSPGTGTGGSVSATF